MKTMRIVAFDPGVTNLGVCVLDDDSRTCPHLDVVPADDIDTFVDTMRRFEPEISKADIVAIESQPPINRDATRILNWIVLFTKLHSRASIVFVSPATRLKRTRLVVDVPKSAPYRVRKAASVDAATRLLNDRYTSDMVDGAWMRVNEKRDDAADAFLIALISSEQTEKLNKNEHDPRPQKRAPSEQIERIGRRVRPARSRARLLENR